MTLSQFNSHILRTFIQIHNYTDLSRVQIWFQSLKNKMYILYVFLGKCVSHNLTKRNNFKDENGVYKVTTLYVSKTVYSLIEKQLI